MAITIPNVFVAGTRIESAPVNANFAAMSNALDKTGDTLTGNLAVGTGITIDGLDISTVPQSGGVFNPNAITFTNIIIGAATTSGIRLDLESGTLAVREGDDSAYGPMLASVYNVPTGGSLNFNEGSAALAWDTTDSTATLALNANVSHRIGAQELVRVINRTGTAIAKGKAVYIVGSNGTRVDVALADASTEATAATTLGITAESIADGAEGFVCVTGLLRAVTTTGLTEGQIVWLSETAGDLTSTRPTQPAHGVFLGLCVKAAGAGGGILYVSVINGQELDELHDVLITTPAANQILKRNSGNTLWVNASGAALTKTDDTNVTLTLGGSASTALVNAASLTLGWTGTLASTRLNSNVVQAITNDTNVTGAISAQTLTLGWTGTLGATRLNSNVVQSVTNDTNVTGSISTQALTLGWTGQLALSRGGTGASTAQGAINALAGATTSGQYLRGDGSNITLSAIQAGDVPTLNQNTTGTAAGLSSTLAVSSGGTGQTSYTDGQLLIGNTATTSLSKATLTAGSGVTITNGNGTITIAATGSGGTVTGVTATSPVASSGGTAPVISLSSAYGDTLNPYGSKTANYVLAAPDGSPGTPSFRALLAADIPTLNQNTTGTAAGLSSTLAVSSGGTGQTSYTDGQLLIGNSSGNTLTKATLTAGSNITITNGNGSITIASTGGGGSGTVTSVSGTGTVNGLTLSGTVTTTGDLTLSGTVDSMSALAGTVTAPSIAASGDPNTGIYFPAADTLAVTTGGTERLRVTSSGNIQPGANDGGSLGASGTAWSDLFLASGGVVNFNAGDVTITHATDTLTFAGAATGYVFSNGNVGIGVTAPGAALDIARDTTAIARIARFSSDATGPFLTLRKARGTQASPTVVAVSDDIGNLSFTGYGGTTHRELVRLTATATRVVSDTDMGAELTIATCTSGTGTFPRMKFMDSGSVALQSSRWIWMDMNPSTGVVGEQAGLYELSGSISVWTGGVSSFIVSAGGNIGIKATGRLYLDGTTLTGDTYITEASANSMSLVVGGTTALSLSSAGVRVGVVGSAGTPPFSVVGDPNTGIYFPAADTVAVTTGGTERFRVDSGGSLGVGATAKIYLDGVGTTGDTYIQESAANRVSHYAGGAEGLRVEASQVTFPTGGSFGFIRGGTSTGPYFQEASGVLRLYTDGAEHFVAFNGASKRFAINSTDFQVGLGATGSTDIRFKVVAPSGAAGAVIVGHNDTTATPGTQKMTLSGARASGTNITGASLFVAAGNGTGTGGSGNIVFETAAAGTTGTTANTLTERMRIDRDGNVGINVSTFGTSAAGVLALKNGTKPTTGPADTIQIYSVDRSAGNTIPAVYTEGTGVSDAGITNTTVTHKIAIEVNGTVYYLLATTNAT